MDGGWVADGLVRPDQPQVLFGDMSTRPLRLRRGQLVSRLTLCGTHDCFGTSTIVHSLASAVAIPQLFSCVPKRQPSAPASLIDPRNRDPPVPSSTPSPLGQSFHISSAYGSHDSPPQRIVQVLEAHRDSFSFDGRPGLVDSVRIPIVTDDSRLFAESPRQVGPHKCRIIDDSIDQLLDWDVIEPWNSRVGYPVVLVKQHDKWRFCVDYRNLNLATTGQAYPMTRTDAIFDALHGKSVFSILDAARGYHQLPIAEDDRWKTAFLTHRGLYQYKRMPFGLKNAPLQFQCYMDSVFGSLRWTSALVYIDDILVFSDNVDDHAIQLATLLDSAIAVGLKFNPTKCHFAYPSLKVLGHRVSTDGLSVLQDRAAAVRELATPRSLKELCHVLGIFGYYRQFIPWYAMVAAPLTCLTKGTCFRKLPDGTWQPHDASGSSSLLSDWGPAHDAAFNSLKEALSNPPTLAFPDFTIPFIFYVDASHDGMAACLHQPFIPCSQLPLVSKSASHPPATPFASAHPSFSLGYASDELDRFPLPFQSVSHFPATLFASTYPSFSFDFAHDELDKLRSSLQSDRVFSHTY